MQSQHNKIYPINDNQESEIILVIPFDQEQDYQVRMFELKMIQLWTLQISLQVIMNVMTIDIYVFWKFLLLCAIISSAIMIFTVINNHPQFQIKQDYSQEKLLFFIYFFVDIFALDGALLIFRFYGTFIIKILQFAQLVNFICAICLLRIQKKKLFTALNLSFATSIPFVFIAAFALIFYTGSEKYLYVLILILSWYGIQMGLSFNLYRLLQKIQNKQYEIIDINNIWTGFILFKYSYYFKC
ncbi:hypothetical protein pb186bvf_018001 [Paramecium bursaria]